MSLNKNNMAALALEIMLANVRAGNINIDHTKFTTETEAMYGEFKTLFVGNLDETLRLPYFSIGVDLGKNDVSTLSVLQDETFTHVISGDRVNEVLKLIDTIAREQNASDPSNVLSTT